MKDLFMTSSDQFIKLINKGNAVYPFIELFFNGRYAGVYSLKKELFISIPENEQVQKVYITGYGMEQNETFTVSEEFSMKESVNLKLETRSRSDYKPGDILVACDNVDGLPFGYMGHAALVIDEMSIIESVMSDPIIRKAPISQFVEYHPIYAHFRPKDKNLGQNAANYAVKYLNEFETYKKNGLNKPIFYFTVATPLTDEWTYIYCSKLVWLCYHFGANYTFPNDHLWFAPEDLYTLLSQSSEFEVIYIHPDYTFFIDL